MVDKVRSSREGHHFHEAWTARLALELLLARNGLVGIAVEGLSPADATKATVEANEIADLVLYYGADCQFDRCDRQITIQLKYSIAGAEAPFVAADAKKTFAKFAATERDFSERYGPALVTQRLLYEIVTNRPIDEDFRSSLAAIADGQALTSSKQRSQAQQIANATGLSRAELASFARRVTLTGRSGNLSQVQSGIRKTVVDWSATSDLVARARIADLADLARRKSETTGELRNVIRRSDVLTALEVDDTDALLPTPASFPEIGVRVARPELAEFFALVPALKKPLLVHAAGGVGKTVFLQSIAASVGPFDRVVLFDCFGGGNYRAIDDSRHLARRGLIHIINSLAVQGLCDVVLPAVVEPTEIIRKAKERFSEVIQTLRQHEPSARLYVLLDACDNAAQQAKDQGEPSFPRQLLESYSTSAVPDGLVLVASSRTERRALATGAASVQDFPLKGFRRSETEAYVTARVDHAVASEIDVAQARSEGNPRVLSHLVENWQELVRAPKIVTPIRVEELIQARLDRALEAVRVQGYKEGDLDAFLGGLTVLPPPVPIGEYATAAGLQASEVDSFASDLAPLLDRTSLGLVFRDEPTEGVVREKYGDDPVIQRRIADNLQAHQGRSLYAARSLPHLLYLLGDAQQALTLAFSSELPPSVVSEVGKRNLRIARLRVAVGLAARRDAPDDLIRLVTELGSVAEAGSRADDYLSDSPEMVIDIGDHEALRRLFEIRTQWPGARHARLGIANILSGNAAEASRHVRHASEWVRHWVEEPEDRGRGNHVREQEMAVFPLYFASRGQYDKAVRDSLHWRPWFGLGVSRRFLYLLRHLPENHWVEFVQELCGGTLGSPAIYLAALEYHPVLNSTEIDSILAKLGRAIAGREEFTKDAGERVVNLQWALVSAAALAVQRGGRALARKLLKQSHLRHPSEYAFAEDWHSDGISLWLAHCAITSCVEERLPTVEDISPSEVSELLGRSKGRNLPAVSAAIAEVLAALPKTRRKTRSGRQTRIAEDYRRLGEVLDRRVEPLLALTVCVATLLRARPQSAAKLNDVMIAWKTVRDTRDPYHANTPVNRFFDVVGRGIAFWAASLQHDLPSSTAEALVDQVLSGSPTPVENLVQMVARFAPYVSLQEAAYRLVPTIEDLIAGDDDTAERASLFAQLAKALRPADRSDSREYFKRGLAGLEALGSADYKMLSELLALAGRLTKPMLTSLQSQRLFDLCEINFRGEPSKFPWVPFAQAAAAASGLEALAQLSRWDDREEARLDDTLAPLVSELVKRKSLDESSALALTILDQPAEYWSWSFSQFVDAITQRSPSDNETFAAEALRQYELSNPLSGGLDTTLGEMGAIIQGRVDPASKTLARLRVLAPISKRERGARNQRANAKSVASPSYAKPGSAAGNAAIRRRIARIAQARRFSTPEDLSVLLLRVDAIRGGMFNRQAIFLDQFARNLPRNRREAFVEALITTGDIVLINRLEALQRCVDAWSLNSIAIRNGRPQYARRFIARHLKELVVGDYGFGRNLGLLAKLAGQSASSIALMFIEQISAARFEIQGVTWLQLAYYIAEKSSDAALYSALSRIIDIAPAKTSAATVQARGEVGGESSVVAGVIWARLGAPDATLRWRAAHSVRLLARLNRLDVLQELVSQYKRQSAGAFGSTTAKFFYWHARLWFAIGLSRACKEFPSRMRDFGQFLRELCFDNSNPHVLIREFAKLALESLAPFLNDRVSQAQLNEVNQSQHNPKVYQPVSDSGWRPASAPKPPADFFFDYDFNKYQPGALGRVFGLHGWVVADLIAEKVIGWDPAVSSMYEHGGRGEGYGRRYHEGVDSRIQSYGQHLCWHALLITAGELLRDRPTSRAEDSYGSWANWLSGRLLTCKGGLWLSDGTGTTPINARKSIGGDGKDSLQISTATLLDLANLKVGHRVGPWLRVSGRWSTADDIDVTIQSALVPAKQGMRAIRKLAKRQPFQQWLPSSREYREEDGAEDQAEPPFLPWIASSEISAGIDEYDCFGSLSAIQRDRPKRSITRSHGLQSSSPFHEAWTDSDGKIVLRSEAWGSRTGFGENERVERAQRLSCRSKWLLRLAGDDGRGIAILILAKKYLKQDRGPGRYLFAGVAAYVDASGFVHALRTNERLRKQRY